MAHLKPGLPGRHLVAMHGDPPHVQGLHGRRPQSPQHCLFECPLVKQAWEAFNYVWHKWGAPNDVTLSWPFVMLSEAIFEIKDDLLGVQGYHVGGFFYIRQPLDILRNFILYFLWSKRCCKHFNNQYSSRKILQQTWVTTIEVGMATWKAINSFRSTQEPSIQARIDQAFRAEWCHLGIFGDDCATIVWHFLPPLYFLNFFNEWWGCYLPPLLGFSYSKTTQGHWVKSANRQLAKQELSQQWSLDVTSKACLPIIVK